ncbi:uncharacterized protein LOC133530118 [Cydia pomonella]|uniref:uncharacterized protein LOC133530118 n=1 Tax=Cydia pomonella TaxID=82600 RepID=UPI002ADD94F0|nr:uncharacterized protein LOC133530118 [Cydia pomonella]XP_061723942.1 uncharacterized protein LOC133530118 [Cydia pomonella]
MKTLFSLLALAVIAQSAVLVDKSATARNNINIGAVYPGDRLLSRSYVYKPAIANTIQYEDFIYRGNASTRISAILATEQGYYTQRPSIWIRSGGLGYPNVTLSVQSLRGYGYYYLIDIWGR